MEWAEILPSPWRGVRFVDSHLHLGEYPDPESIIGWASSTDCQLFSCGIDKDTSEMTLKLALSCGKAVKAFVGVHPSEAEASRGLDWLAGAAGRATGVGEIGLDPKYSAIKGGSVQLRAFEDQLEVAKRSGKPVQVHSRGASKACLDSLSASGVRGVLMHWFDAEEDLAKVMERGYFVSFGPALLYSKKLQRMAVASSHLLVLVESDGPVKFEPLGGACGPQIVPSVSFKLAELWGMSFEETSRTLLNNSLRFISRPGKG